MAIKLVESKGTALERLKELQRQLKLLLALEPSVTALNRFEEDIKNATPEKQKNIAMGALLCDETSKLIIMLEELFTGLENIKPTRA